MRIGIDIDGTLTDIEKFQLDFGSKFFSRYNKFIVKPNGYETAEIFNVDDTLDNEFWDKYYFDYLKNEPIRRLASEIIKMLKDKGNEIYIITARHGENNISYEETKNFTKAWLDKNDVIYDKLIFSPEEKLDTCLENKIDIMVEDKPENINTLSSKIPVICFNAGYNQNCNGNNIYRAYSWYDVNHKIKNIINSKVYNLRKSVT